MGSADDKSDAGKSQAPYFTVLTPTYNRSRLLLRALQNVQRQTFRDFEVVVVDDGSTEDIASVVRGIAPNAKLVRQEQNSGIARARNAGLDVARGRYIAFLDSDDLWHPRYLRYQYAANEAIPNAIFTFTNYFSKGPKYNGPVRQLTGEQIAENALLHMVMQPFVHTMSCFVAPRSSIKLLGGFNPRFKRFDDLDLYVRLLAGRPGRSKLACLEKPAPNLPQVLVLKTIHVDDRTLQEYVDEWTVDRQEFVDAVFSYDFMRPYGHLRRECESRLHRGQQQFFSNFRTD